MMKPPRPLGDDEIEQLLKHDVPAHLASLDADGFPRVTTLWFVWTSGAFYLTSIADRPHLRRLQCNPRAGICVDLEELERADGKRPNRRVRATGKAELFVDDGAAWTTRITEKYVRGPAAAAQVRARGAVQRWCCASTPQRVTAGADFASRCRGHSHANVVVTSR